MKKTNKKSKKNGAILCAVVIIAILAGYLAALVIPVLSQAGGILLALGFLLVYGVIIGAVIVGVVLALRQRLKEIDNGEEEDAKQY